MSEDGETIVHHKITARVFVTMNHDDFNPQPKIRCLSCDVHVSSYRYSVHLQSKGHLKKIASSAVVVSQKQQTVAAQLLQRQQLLQSRQQQQQQLLQRQKQVSARLDILTAKKSAGAIAGSSKAETGVNRRIKSEANQRGVEVDWIDGIDFGFIESASLVDGFKVSKNVVIKSSAALSLLGISPVHKYSP
jgi:hypothetical protein